MQEKKQFFWFFWPCLLLPDGLSAAESPLNKFLQWRKLCKGKRGTFLGDIRW